MNDNYYIKCNECDTKLNITISCDRSEVKFWCENHLADMPRNNASLWYVGQFGTFESKNFVDKNGGNIKMRKFGIRVSNRRASGVYPCSLSDYKILEGKKI